MANSYLQFSEVLVADTDKKKAWVTAFLKQPDDVNPEEGTPEYASFALWCEEHGVDDPSQAEYYPSFTYSWEGKGKELWLRSEEACYLNEVAALVQAFFKRFKINKIWTLTYAATCSKMRVGEFSGGGFIVHPYGKKVEWSQPWQLFEKVRLRLKKKGVHR